MVDWNLKREAFLYKILEKCKEDISGINNKAKEANELIEEFELPPFIRKLSKPSTPHIRHPLSGEKYDFEVSLEHEDCEKLQELINEVKNEKPKKQFLRLWKEVPEKINKLKLIPIDKRVPSYFLLNQAQISSAVSSAFDGSKFSPSLLLFSIASAQDFIFTARRTQDFWMGSFLLSYFMWIGIKYIVEELGPDCIIFPSLRGQPLFEDWVEMEIKGNKNSKINPDRLLVANLPNAFTAIIPSNKKDSVKEIRDSISKEKNNIFNDVKSYVEEAITKSKNNLNKLISLATEDISEPELKNKTRSWLKNSFSSLSNNKVWNDIWERQKEDFLKSEIFWAIYPWSTDFTQAGKEYEQLLNVKTGPLKGIYENWEALCNKLNDSKSLSASYQPASTILGRIFAARKNLRNFEQSKEPELKCSLCGIREALHPEWEENIHVKLRSFWNVLSRIEVEKDKKYKLAGRIRRGDRLCAVCLVKRLCLEAYFCKKLNIDYHLFPSTSTMATASFKEEILEKSDKILNEIEHYNKKVKDFLENNKIFYTSFILPKHRKQIKNFNQKPVLEDFLRIDGEWLYEESFIKEKIEREYEIKITDEKKLEKAKGALKNLIEKARKLGIKPPSKYYSLIYFDGDKMSDWLNGKKLNEIELKRLVAEGLDGNIPDLKRALTPSSHMVISEAQKSYSLKVVPEVVEVEHSGRVIYAGGDDIMAFLPIKDLLDVMGCLSKSFKGGFIKENEEIYMAMDNKASTSAGVVICHHTHPLSHALEKLATALKDGAKEREGRDAFFFSVMKRAGEELCFGSKWNPIIHLTPIDAIGYLKKLSQLLKEENKEEKLSPRLFYQLKEEILSLSHSTFQTEFKRLIKRHTKEVSNDEKEFLNQRLPSLLEKLFIENKTKPIHFLLLAKFIEEAS